MDELVLSMAHKLSKITDKKGKHQIKALTSGERGLTTKLENSKAGLWHGHIKKQ